MWHYLVHLTGMHWWEREKKIVDNAKGWSGGTNFWAFGNTSTNTFHIKCFPDSPFNRNKHWYSFTFSVGVLMPSTSKPFLIQTNIAIFLVSVGIVIPLNSKLFCNTILQTHLFTLSLFCMVLEFLLTSKPFLIQTKLPPLSYTSVGMVILLNSKLFHSTILQTHLSFFVWHLDSFNLHTFSNTNNHWYSL